MNIGPELELANWMWQMKWLLFRVRVSDTGVGMDPEALARAFEPYFSTKVTGTGLGLPIAKRNVEASGGTIAVVSERDRGTTVELTLPVAARLAESRP